tara:strand:+ start:549 stop:1415 length:867 start_codon:yes stop_codon:yes gene_type:complete
MKYEISKFSPAKLNLFLEIVGKNKNGYHNLESLMSFCDYGDSISVAKSEDLSFEIDGPFSKFLKIKDNIILKTISKLESYTKRKINVHIKLTKKLPIASGMGGGSSNAATLINCIIDLLKIDIKEDFNEFLFKIGADVPFCFYRKTGLVKGYGEKITFLRNKIPELYVLLVNPNVQISTRKIFESFVVNSQKTAKFYDTKMTNKDFVKFLSKKRNDLEYPAIVQCDKVRKILKELENKTHSLLARMTGSGGTCFALYDEKKKLLDAEKTMKKVKDNYWVQRCKLINAI